MKMAATRIKLCLSLACLALGCLLASCKPAAKETPDALDEQAPMNAPTSAKGGSGETVHPLGTSGGAITPVGGSDSVEGAGGGSVGQAAKDRARKAANSSSSSVGQTGEDSTGN